MIKKVKGILQSFILSLLIFIVMPSTLLGFLASGSTNILFLIEAIIVISLLDIGANVLNNYADWNIDILNNKRDTLHNAVSKEDLLYVYIILLILVWIMLLLLQKSIYLELSVLSFIILGIIYSEILKLKDISPFNYVAIGLAYGAIPFSIGFFLGTSSLESYLIYVPLVIFLSLATFAHTITKDYGDVEGDSKNNKKTLPVIFGKSKALLIQSMLIVISYLTLILFYLLNDVNIYYLVSVVSMVFGLLILNMIKLAKDSKAVKKAALYNKFNHFILRLILIFVTIFITYKVM